MVFETIALSAITALLFLLMLPRKRGTVKCLLGILTAVCAAVSLALFLWMVKDSGGADRGKELFQLYIPCGIYLVLAVWGIIAAAVSRKKK